jgi:GNAT superfamily N-acetyltransferase
LESELARLTIVSAEESDLPPLARMNKRLIQDEGSRNPMSIGELEARMRGWLRGDWAITLFMEDSRIVGYAVHQERQDDYDASRTLIYLRQFYVEPDRRGRGLGRAAFEHLRRTHFPDGAEVVLEVLASNPEGQRFWSSLGFEAYALSMRRK